MCILRTQPKLFWPFWGHRRVKELDLKEVTSTKLIWKKDSRKEATQEAEKAMQGKYLYSSKSYGIGTFCLFRIRGQILLRGEECNTLAWDSYYLSISDPENSKFEPYASLEDNRIEAFS